MGYRSRRPIPPDDRLCLQSPLLALSDTGHSLGVCRGKAHIVRDALKSGNDPKADVGHADCPLRASLGSLSANAV